MMSRLFVIVCAASLQLISAAQQPGSKPPDAAVVPSGQKPVVPIEDAAQAVASARELLGAKAIASISAERITKLDESWVFADRVSPAAPAWRVLARGVTFDVTPANSGYPEAPPCTAGALDLTIVLRASDAALIGLTSPWVRAAGDDFDVRNRTGKEYLRSALEDGEVWKEPIRPANTVLDALRVTNFGWYGAQIIIHAYSARTVIDMNGKQVESDNWSIEIRCHTPPGVARGNNAIRGRPPGVNLPPETPETLRSSQVHMLRYTVSGNPLAWTAARNTPWPVVVEAPPPLIPAATQGLSPVPSPTPTPK